MPLSFVNAAPPQQTPLTDERGRVTAPWFAYLLNLQSAGAVSTAVSGIPNAGATVTGLLKASDWVAFNAKQAPLGFTPLNPANNLLELSAPATARINLGLGSAALANLSAMPAMTLAGTVNLNSVGFTGATLGNFTVGRASNFATAAAIWSLNVLNAGGGDNVSVGQSSATYGSGGGVIAWVGNSNAFLYFNSAQDFRIGAGIGATPIMTCKGAGRVLVGSLSDDGATLLQVGGTIQGKTNGQAYLDLWNAAAGTPTPAGGSRWRIWADNVGGGGASLTFGFWDLANNRMAGGFDNNGWFTASNGLSLTNSANINFGSGWINWSPTVTAGGSMTVSGISIVDAQYLRMGPLVFFKVYLTCTLGGTASDRVFITTPIAVAAGSQNAGITVAIQQSSGLWNAGWGYYDTSNHFIAFNGASGNFTLGGAGVLIEGFFRA